MIRVKFSRIRPAAIFLIVMGAAAISSCNGSGETAANDQPAMPLPRIVHQGGSNNEAMQLAPPGVPGMTLTTLRTVQTSGTLETSGQVTFDDRRVATIISRVAGRIDGVRVSQWDYVRRGEPIATLYSPDIMTAEAEYLQARASVSSMNNVGPDGSEFARSMLEAARRKLDLLGIGADQIAELKIAAPDFVMRAPISGNVVQNQALKGSAVSPGDVLYSLGTLEDVWIQADIYEDDLSRVKVGQQLRAVTTAYPDQVFEGTIARISPNVDPDTHTVQIRCEVKNPGFKLKPQMLARVTILVNPGATLIVPLDALVFETDRYFAFVDTGGGLLERREVTIGTWNQAGFARVVSGLAAGDRVVTGETIQINALWHQARGESS